MIDVAPVAAAGLAEPLRLLEESLRDGVAVPAAFAGSLREAVEAGTLEVLEARIADRPVGVAVLAYRLNVAAAGPFASIEDMYVRPEARRRGVGRALLECAGERCAARGISYVEVQVEDDEAAAFYCALGYEPERGVLLFSRSYPLEEPNHHSGV